MLQKWAYLTKTATADRLFSFKFFISWYHPFSNLWPMASCLASETACPGGLGKWLCVVLGPSLQLVELLKHMQRKAMKLVEGLENKTYM